MAKLQIKSEPIATFGDIFQIMDLFECLSLGKLVDSSLGKRDLSWNTFQYSKVFETLLCNYLCSGDCLKDINMLAPQLSLRPGTRIPSADTVGRVLKSFATENINMLARIQGFRIASAPQRNLTCCCSA